MSALGFNRNERHFKQSSLLKMLIGLLQL